MQVETEVPKPVRLVPEDLSLYNQMNAARVDIESLLFLSAALR
jgi:hypothetical protein